MYQGMKRYEEIYKSLITERINVPKLMETKAMITDS
jgi:hypothetical protein